ncbi:PD-(D/E)XK nuclease family protein [Aneurinibacillus sp. BA2021]|nr:PD-(D/E)XK nuclease family protein [Aneurinibacillus sp. BA2021]
MSYYRQPYPQWSWSLSRDQMFHTCKRQYFYHYYQSHGGWLLTASPEAQTAYRLKQLTNLYLVLGDAVHTAAQKLIALHETRQAYPPADTIIAYIRRMLNRAYQESKQPDEWWGYPKQSTMLHEMYYDGELPRDRIEAVSARIAGCVEHLLASESLREMQDVEHITLLEVEKLNDFIMDDEKIYVKLDALYRRGDGTYVITDWKTGKVAEKNEEQLWLYALYLHEYYGVPLSLIEVRTEYLLDGQCVRSTPTEEHLEWIRHKIRVSLQSMRSYLADSYYNRPLPLESFTGAGTEMTCRMCNFRQICSEKQDDT